MDTARYYSFAVRIFAHKFPDAIAFSRMLLKIITTIKGHCVNNKVFWRENSILMVEIKPYFFNPLL